MKFDLFWNYIFQEQRVINKAVDQIEAATKKWPTLGVVLFAVLLMSARICNQKCFCQNELIQYLRSQALFNHQNSDADAFNEDFEKWAQTF